MDIIQYSFTGVNMKAIGTLNTSLAGVYRDEQISNG